MGWCNNVSAVIRSPKDASVLQFSFWSPVRLHDKLHNRTDAVRLGADDMYL